MSVPALPLDQLAARINAEHEAAASAMNSALLHAVEAGRLLSAAKAQIPHGEWGPWLGENFHGSARTAQAYMRLARDLPELEAKTQRVADLPIREALALLADPRPEPEPARERPRPAVPAPAPPAAAPSWDTSRVQPRRAYTHRMKDLISAAISASTADDGEIEAIPVNPLMLDGLVGARDLLDRVIEISSGILTLPPKRRRALREQGFADTIATVTLATVSLPSAGVHASVPTDALEQAVDDLWTAEVKVREFRRRVQTALRDAKERAAGE